MPEGAGTCGGGPPRKRKTPSSPRGTISRLSWRRCACRNAAGRVQESGTVNVAAAEVVIDSSAASCCGTPFAATPGSAFSAASISTRRSSCDVLPHEFLKTRHSGLGRAATGPVSPESAGRGDLDLLVALGHPGQRGTAVDQRPVGEDAAVPTGPVPISATISRIAAGDVRGKKSQCHITPPAGGSPVPCGTETQCRGSGAWRPSTADGRTGHRSGPPPDAASASWAGRALHERPLPLNRGPGRQAGLPAAPRHLASRLRIAGNHPVPSP